MPELIFNQFTDQDLYKKHRYFEIDHEMNWRLNDNNCPRHDACYICEKQQYCMIFYQRDKSTYCNQKGINKGLIQIDNPEFLEMLRAEYRLKYSQIPTSLEKMTTPLIFGTPVRDSLQPSGTSGVESITDI